MLPSAFPTTALRLARRGIALLAVLGFALGGCVDPHAPRRSGLEASQSLGAPRSSGLLPSLGRSASARGSRDGGTMLLAGDRAERGALYRDGGDTVTLNLVEVPIAVAAKTVFRDILGANFVMTDDVVGRVTLQTARPMKKQALVDIFQTVLADKGYAIQREGQTYRIVSSGMLQTGALGIDRGEGVAVGRNARIVPLNAISATEMERILKPIAPEGVIRADPKRNILVISGTAQQLQAMQDAIQIFDVDWMRGMSAAVFPLGSGADPAGMKAQLDEIFGAGEGGPSEGTVRFVASKEMNSILAITSRPQDLARARQMIARLQDAAEESTSQTFIYRVENRPAKEMATIVQGMMEKGSASSSTGVAEGLTALRSAVGADTLGDTQAKLGGAAPLAVSGGRITVVADDPNNALVVMASRSDYERLLPVLRSIDRMPAQVLIEAVIAEVSLNDDLKFGVRWFFEHGDTRVKLSNIVTEAGAALASSVAPGFSYFLKNSDFSVIVNALSGITQVKVISSPTLTVLDNRTARLQIGDQVPIVKQSAASTLTANAPIVNEVELKDTGVILNVTPRVSSNGQILLAVDQEVSDVVKTTTSGIDSPTIRQRKVSTTVVVGDGQSLVLGGLVQEKRERTDDKVPVLGDVPVLGAAFRNKVDSVKRTELMIFIRPRVMRDGAQAEAITREFRDALSDLDVIPQNRRLDGTTQRILR